MKQKLALLLLCFTMVVSLCAVFSFGTAAASASVAPDVNTTPPEAINILADYKTCTLVVPNGSSNDYKNHEEWGKFKNIQENSNTSYNPIAENNTQNNICYDAKSHSLSFNIKNQTSISIYDTMGKMLINKSVNPNATHLYINLNSGIYIVNITTQTGQNNCSKIAVK